MDIAQKLENYTLVYKEILSQSMAENTPFEKLTKKIDEYCKEYGISNDKNFEMTSALLSQMLQIVTTSSQEIALKFMIEAGKIDAQNELLKAQAEVAKAEIPLKQKELELAEKRLDLAQIEAGLNEQRVELLKAQVQSEMVKKDILGLEIKSQELKNAITAEQRPHQLAIIEKQSILLDKQIAKLEKDTELALSQQKAIDRQVKDNRLIKGMSVLSDFLQGVQGGGLVAPAGMNQTLFNMTHALTKDDGVSYPNITDYSVKKQ